jgi:predicted nucleic acid-binding protein
MIVVSDTTTLIILIKANKLAYLHNLFSKILIPRAVYDELTYKESVVLPDFIHVVDVMKSETLEMLMFVLDQGESEAITLAQEQKLPLIIDEKKGRKIAKNLQLDILGLLGILFLNIKKGFISEDEAKLFLDQAIDQGYRISSTLIKQMFLSLREK